MNNLMVFSAVLQGMAALLQLTAAFFSVRLIRITGWKVSWLMISGALCIMAVRRIHSLWLLLGRGAHSSLPSDEIFALIISLLMLGGVITITHLFQAIKGSAAAALETEHQRMEEILRQSEENYRLLVNQIPALVFKGYSDWTVDFFDNKIEALTGYTKEDFDQRRLKWSEVILPEDLDYAKNIFMEALKTDDSYVREHRILRKDGEIRWVQCWGRIFRDAAGKIDHISGVTFDVTPRKEIEEALRQSEANLQCLTSQLLTVQEKERARVARELHDELGQSLVVMKMRIRSMQRRVLTAEQITAEDFDELDNALDGMVGNVRRISQDLCPYFLDDLGLEVALRRLLEEFSKHCRISLELEGDLTGLNHLIPAGDQIHIYRIFQECLTNIARHSGATTLRVTVSLDNKDASFSLADNGRGFDVDSFQKSATKSRGIGLATLKERARLLAGDLSISSKPGKGASINLVIPISSGS